VAADDELALDFNPLHTLGFIATDWIERHCRVPGGVYEGEPLLFNGWQLYVTANHYRVKPDAVADPRRLLAPFVYRRSVIVGPQKCGKSPWGAGYLLLEAVGPSLFAGWAKGGERYRCSDHGCGCGWEYRYEPGEAMGVPRRKSLLGLLAYAETQTANVYEPLQTMIHNGPLSEFVHVREGFIRLPNRGKIVPLTSAARSKLGQPLTGGLGDESGLYTASNKVLDSWQTMRRGIAAMQGRTVELTNPWDPAENSAAQQAFDSQQKDIFRYYRKPPADLSYANKRERHRIHVYVYADSPWVDPTTIDAEAAELVETDPAQAERFFGNRLVIGQGAWMPDKLWDSRKAPRDEPADGAEVCLGFDGSDVNDHTGIRLRTLDGYRFTPTYLVGGERRPTWWDPKKWPGGKVPRSEVHAAVEQIATRYKVIRGYCDPPGWQSEIADWALKYGEDVFVEWSTNRVSQMHPALERAVTDLVSGRSTHDGCEVTAVHVANARKLAKPGEKYLLGKPNDHQKIDMAMADVLAWEAGEDARAAGWNKRPKNAGTGRVVVM
jgi:hypothetical protein